MFRHASLYSLIWLILSASVLTQTPGSIDIGFGSDSDLTKFVTRPDIRYPIFKVDIYDAASISAGYWFLAPYANVIQDPHARKYYQPCQTGPAIYDGDGELVWAGACAFRNQNTCDFRATEFDGTYILSGILTKYGEDRGRGFLLDATYRPIANITVPHKEISMNMHELKLVDDGRHALIIIHRPEFADVTSLNIQLQAGFVANVGFREIDVVTKETLFEWWALDHVSLTESTVKVDQLQGPFPHGWNFFHGNSVDKDSEGNYMISARFTDCIYKVSGKDGSILWRLGGVKSDFELDQFNFSRQHDAQWVESSPEREVITFLDNATDDFINVTSTYSSGLLVELNKKTMVAKVLQRWIRPDQKLSALRGNFQNLPNGNKFAAWSENSYFSEHAADGRVLMEARFTSERFVTYRSYKLNFTAEVSGVPIVAATAYGPSYDRSVTVMHVSWNGQTEVAHWNFYREDGSLIGGTRRTGFETRYQTAGSEQTVYVEAIDKHGSVMGTSITIEVDQQVETRENWKEDGQRVSQSATENRAESDQLARGQEDKGDSPSTVEKINPVAVSQSDHEKSEL